MTAMLLLDLGLCEGDTIVGTPGTHSVYTILYVSNMINNLDHRGCKECNIMASLN